MAITPLKVTSILFIIILIIPLLQIPLFSLAISTDLDDDEEYYTVDQPQRVRKGARCDSLSKNICNGVSVNNGTGLLQCCKFHCHNVLRDQNNCGNCGHRCGFGELCCNGICTNVVCNVDHCGRCDKKCSPGVKCEYGTCGYA
ncbi:hypothetical protein GIB67_039186 [Kingdonia uniflora]|uniref:Uncharacterized protein n=1 Tax=Kingdonia uniflora TaxID=39325 RepID=A0A7J7MLQ5_9MAGN|nr:hypothetical protein GIB67_039186 [Kingdonia uniflora]